MGRPRRSSSGGSHLEMSASSRRRSSSFAGGDDGHNGRSKQKPSATKDDNAEKLADALAKTRHLLESLLAWRDSRGESLLHGKMWSLNSSAADIIDEDPRRLALSSALLVRLHQLDQQSSSTSLAQPRPANRDSNPGNSDYSKNSSHASVRLRWLTQPDISSGYTPLHSAVYRGDLASILLLLRHASWKTNDVSSASASGTGLGLAPPRMAFRPMDALFGDESARVAAASDAASCLPVVVLSKDREGLTPGQLLLMRQRGELEACRMAVLDRPIDRMELASRTSRRRRRSSFDIDDEGDEEDDEQNEFHLLHRSISALRHSSGAAATATGEVADVRYGCEVFTFGRAHHCALGVGQDSSTDPKKASRPRRVQHFALGGTMGRLAGASAVSGAAHHTLVATANGQLFAFGLGKGGRLGTGDENHCPVPTRVGGCLLKRHVVSISAAENHSICATRCGQVFAWGSNRFGQLGVSTTGSDDGGAPVRCLPRRVDDLKSLHCVEVSAGAKHSVALTKRGEVYVWGDNSAGQLGLGRRSGIHKPQRVEALWQSNNPRVAVAVAASDQATLVLTLPSDTGLRVNSVYAWGHGNSVPTRVHFEPFGRAERSRLVNPVSISSARFHNVVVTSNGLVYTWGLHADPLGTGKGKANQFLHAPQLVTGMLPENGGGVAVAASASENHTAVVTDTGELFTWGATYGKNILGHEGVSWQPDPKRVPGVHRAVGVAAAKEHTILLIGTSFPPPMSVPRDATLEQLVASAVAKHVDLFSAIPSLVMAERTQCNELIGFCEEFVRRNLDGVLNVGQRSTMDCYLDDQIVSSTFASSAFACATLINDDRRDSRIHPLLSLVPLAGSHKQSWYSNKSLPCLDEWLSACKAIAEMERTELWLRTCLTRKRHDGISVGLDKQRARSGSRTAQRQALDSQSCSDRCLELTVNMDLSSRELAEGRFACLTKELRSVRKRLSQIVKLQASSAASKIAFTTEELAKIARRPQLEADVHAFELALKVVEKRLQEISLDERKSLPPTPSNAEIETLCPTSLSNLSIDRKPPTLRCDVCSISCPDEKSYALHMSGRKHRNRVAQVEDNEKASVAASMAVQHAKVQLLSPVPSTSSKPQQAKSVAWKRENACPAIPYSLPNPPIPVPDSIVRPVPTASLRDIMLEEARMKAKEPSKIQQPYFSLPPDAAPPLKSPPWAKQKPTVVVPPALPISPPQAAASGMALGDFISAPKPVPPPLPQRTSPAAKPAWGGASQATASSEIRAKAFVDIQDQEIDRKLRQDKAVAMGDGNSRKWFVAQRERAASIQDIQKSDERERDMRLFVEDQFRIEKQILEEIEAQKGAEPSASARQRSGPSKSRPRARKGKSANASDGSDPKI